MDALWLFLSMAIGSIGLAFFIYGKKQARIPQIVVGILLMGYPYFISNAWIMLAIAVALVAGLWVGVRVGL